MRSTEYITMVTAMFLGSLCVMPVTAQSDLEVDTLTVNKSAVIDQQSEPAAGSIPAGGKIFHYTFDADEGGTVTDQSGQGHTATIQGSPTWTSGGKVNGCYYYDGVGDKINVGLLDDHLLGLSSLSVAFWVKPESGGSYVVYVLFSNTTDYNAMYETYIHSADVKVTHCVRTTASDWGGPQSSVVPFDEWTHVAFTWDGTTETCYVNGSPFATKPRSGTISRQGTQKNMGIGGRIDAQNPSMDDFRGWIDEAIMYDRCLDAGEIAELYAYNAGGEPAPEFALDVTGDAKIVGAVTADSASIENDLTVNGKLVFDETTVVDEEGTLIGDVNAETLSVNGSELVDSYGRVTAPINTTEVQVDGNPVINSLGEVVGLIDTTSVDIGGSTVIDGQRNITAATIDATAEISGGSLNIALDNFTVDGAGNVTAGGVTAGNITGSSLDVSGDATFGYNGAVKVEDSKLCVGDENNPWNLEVGGNITADAAEVGGDLKVVGALTDSEAIPVAAVNPAARKLLDVSSAPALEWGGDTKKLHGQWEIDRQGDLLMGDFQ